MGSYLIPIKCPVCGAPVDRGLTMCEYCETSYLQPVSKIEEGPDIDFLGHLNMTNDDIVQMLNDGILIRGFYDEQL